jgi:hypothetical protein
VGKGEVDCAPRYLSRSGETKTTSESLRGKNPFDRIHEQKTTRLRRASFPRRYVTLGGRAVTVSSRRYLPMTPASSEEVP